MRAQTSIRLMAGEAFQPSFNASLKVDFQGSRVTSDGGLILVCELDERLRLGDLIAAAGGKPSDAAALRSDGAGDCRVTGGIGRDGGRC